METSEYSGSENRSEQPQMEWWLITPVKLPIRHPGTPAIPKFRSLYNKIDHLVCCSEPTCLHSDGRGDVLWLVPQNNINEKSASRESQYRDFKLRSGAIIRFAADELDHQPKDLSDGKTFHKDIDFIPVFYFIGGDRRKRGNDAKFTGKQKLVTI